VGVFEVQRQENVDMSESKESMKKTPLKEKGVKLRLVYEAGNQNSFERVILASR